MSSLKKWGIEENEPRPFITLSKPPCGSPKKSQKAINDDVHEAYESGFGDIINSSNQTHPRKSGSPVKLLIAGHLTLERAT